MGSMLYRRGCEELRWCGKVPLDVYRSFASCSSNDRSRSKERDLLSLCEVILAVASHAI